MEESEKKNLMVAGAIGAGGLVLFLVMRGRGQSINPPVQAQSPQGSGLGSQPSYFSPFYQPPSLPPSPQAPALDCMTLGCPPGFACVNGHCQVEVGSACDDTCVPPDHCVAGICVHVGYSGPFKCSNDNTCPQGQRCVGGICVPGPNSCGGFDCGDGYHCVNGQCVPNPEAPGILSPVAHMALPGMAKGGAAPARQTPLNSVGGHDATRPTLYTDPTDGLREYNLTSAFYSMRFH